MYWHEASERGDNKAYSNEPPKKPKPFNNSLNAPNVLNPQLNYKH